ncbi:hypothetical protein BCO18442_00722 [Burkholderia contaminans]|nr:hypothetical protein BCO18442_00722 [Burkholderia contaminans]
MRGTSSLCVIDRASVPSELYLFDSPSQPVSLRVVDAEQRGEQPDRPNGFQLEPFAGMA